MTVGTVQRAMGGGTIGLYADPAGAYCDVRDDVPGTLDIYVVHSNIPEATGVQFSAPIPDCMTGAIWVGDTKPFVVTLGNSQTGVAIGYGSCLEGPIHVLTIHYQTSGTSETCCEYPILPHPGIESGRIESVDCWENLYTDVVARPAIVNADAQCQCGGGALPTHETTWGRLKALYEPTSR